MTLERAKDSIATADSAEKLYELFKSWVNLNIFSTDQVGLSPFMSKVLFFSNKKFHLNENLSVLRISLNIIFKDKLIKPEP